MHHSATLDHFPTLPPSPGQRYPALQPPHPAAEAALAEVEGLKPPDAPRHECVVKVRGL